MITPAEIVAKANRLYPQMIAAWLHNDEAFFPRRIPADRKVPGDISAAVRAVERLRERSKEQRGYGYSVEWETRRSRTHGLNAFPESIAIESADDLVRLIGKRGEFQTLVGAAGKLRSAFPALNDWLLEKSRWKELLAAADELDDLLRVTRYFVDNPRPDCFAREIPLPISTKLVEQNRKLLAPWLDRLLPPESIDVRFSPKEFAPRYGLRYARPHILFRVLDRPLCDELGLIADELSLPVQTVNKLPVRDARVIVVENKVNLLTLPPLPRGIALGGLGTAVTLLSDIGWLNDASIEYWGDLDVEGLAILSLLRGIFPHTRSFLMDGETLRRFERLAIPGTNRRLSRPLHLTPTEFSLYDELAGRNLRLEQERIPQPHVKAALTS